MRTLALAFLASSVCLLAADAPKLRLGADIRPTRYAADLTAVPGTATFSGVIDIDVALAKPASLVWLNASDLTIQQATVNSQPRGRRIGRRRLHRAPPARRASRRAGENSHRLPGQNQRELDRRHFPG
jgi:aminopeptidase N